MKGVHKDVVAPLLKRAWFLQGKVKFMDLSFDMILAIFETKQDKLKVIEGGPWTGDGWAIAVGEWDVNRYANNVIPTMVPMWVQVHNLPLVLIQDQYEDRFGWLIGDPVDVSKTSLVVHESVVQKNFLRVRVLVDSTQPLVDGYYVFEEDEDEPLWVEFKYERQLLNNEKIELGFFLIPAFSVFALLYLVSDYGSCAMARGRPRGGAAAVDRDIEDFGVREIADLRRQVDYLTRRLGELEVHHVDADIVAKYNLFAEPDIQRD
ncbi:hypothetical protein QQ045_001981 [Rhodiola kirilowii]